MNIRPRSMKVALLIGAALGCTGAWALPPLAEPAVTRTETVKYSPAEAATPEGAAALYARLKAAAEKVCADPSPVPLGMTAHDPAFEACASAALADAVRKTGSPLVSMVHQYDGRALAMASR